MIEYFILIVVRTLLFLRACLVLVVNWMISPFTLVKMFILSKIARAHKHRHMARLQQTIATTEDYQTWWLTAKRLDIECGYIPWSEDNTSPYYDAEELARHLRDLQRWLAQQDPQFMAFQLRSVLSRNFSGITHEALFPYYCGTKKLLEQYVVQVINCLEFTYASQKLTLADRAAFFRDTLQAYGRTALILSGGDALGLYHLGVMKGLADADMLPRVICGTSLGAALAALACTRRESQLPGLFSLADVDMENYERMRHDREAIKARLRIFFHEGNLVHIPNLKAFMHRDFGDVTFKEAFNISQRALVVTVWGKGGPLVFNHILTPDVVVWSAVCLSIDPKKPVFELMAKGTDGVLSVVKMPEQSWRRRGQHLAVMADTPLQPLSELFDVSFHIVSQAQAHVVPFLLLKPRGPLMYRNHSIMTRIAAGLLLFVLGEMRHFFVQLLHWVGVNPHGNIQYALTQRYEGDITIIPIGTVEDYLAALHVPSKEHTEQAVVHGCRRAWPYMTRVMYHCLVERRLEKCLADLKVAMKISDEAIQEPHTPTATHLTPRGFPDPTE